ncbi:MAG: PhzF family phenazine biosynthesis protein [Myxococcota bacterium]|nr:PhzF family phenazine biosynthesis protein [Myxococcota bacterium]
MTTVHRVDAFSASGQGGNPAGVVLAAQGLSAARMQTIAATMGLSETAFVLPHPEADRALRFFTPTAEVGLCGHATIASWHLLMEQNHLGPGNYRMWTRSGMQTIRCEADGRVAMSQNRPQFGSVIDPEPVARSLGIDASQILESSRIPVQVASTGLHKIFAPIRSLESLMAIVPDQDAIEALSRSFGAIGVYCYTLESQHGGIAQCRNFAPVVGIEEDSATGTSAAATGCLLYHHGIVDSTQAADLVFEQGYALGQPSEIQVRLEVEGRTVERVWVAGRATTEGTREIEA